MRTGNAAVETPFTEMETGPSEAERAERDLLALAGADAFEALEAAIDPGLVALDSGSMIRTQDGEAPLEALAPGDFVATLDDGLVRVVTVEPVESPGDAPVILPEGAFGATRSAAFGPMRRIFYRGGAADLLFGAGEVLIEARDLPPGFGARGGDWALRGGAIALTLSRPALIWSDGVLTETGASPAFAAPRPVLRPMEAAALLSFASRR